MRFYAAISDAISNIYLTRPKEVIVFVKLTSLFDKKYWHYSYNSLTGQTVLLSIAEMRAVISNTYLRNQTM